jgi:hypothetical protein
MYSAEYEIEVELSPAEAWEKLRDLSLADQYVPGLTGLEITTEKTAGEGASRRVYQGDKLVLDETVVAWREGEGFTLRLHRGEKGPVPPMTEAFFDYGLRVSGDRVYLHNRMRYRLGLGPLGKLLQKLALGKFVAGAVRDSTVAQKLFYESGEKVSKEALAAAKQELALH